METKYKIQPTKGREQYYKIQWLSPTGESLAGNDPEYDLRTIKNLAIKRGMYILAEGDKQIKINLSGQEVDHFPWEK